ncbi:MAG: isocitrate dehydrogenase (NADP(+)) [Microbacterium sp. SCN 70-200]|uniref:NADP-dependent isocitrate dehydrogenase n=1 Tax=unclassified Microbacterium TaxID=2609290 RepID=UPI00086D1912|nr:MULTISPECIES: NADP-dependent isocitrate dehydrogenase [unclassified Microbacterium]MBN9215792.1 NADP-dependent isocitrate dehydrogenase [Microbacterium sp.]ODT39927.1 MAG: isocitrate dehydrogenase (NADP(+)) [Microbacterium sp. SCN 70-200]OJV81950.1 MAG: isocitrate dehydrogenase (NADP(+)) [Microbacterium sp. 70-16]
MPESTIIYTHTDEAPALATASFLPIVQAYAGQAGVEIDTRDISLAARILAAFPQRLTPEQQVGDALAELGGLATLPEANIIKLPNISASIPQLKAAIAELQSQGYDIPEYPDEAATVEQKDIRARYDRIKGSAVNPVLREGNSDRRAPLSVKNYARKHPHRNKPFASGSKTRVATMTAGDFMHNEKSWVAAHDDVLTIRHVQADGTVTVLKESLKVLPREIIDGTTMSAKALDAFLAETLAQAKAENVLYSVHLKATMMKVSDPIIFGHVVRAFFKDVFDTYGAQLAEAGLNGNNGLGAILAGLGEVDGGETISARIAQDIENGPRLSYVNSDKGITNLHVPSDVIVDASMPALIRNGGKLWGVDGGEDDTIAVIPDSSYAGVYRAVIDDVIANGPLDPATIGTVPNVGLMAQAAEEYGSHDKTFEMAADGVVQVVDSSGEVVIEHDVEAGDIWRGTQTKYVPLVDWVRLAVSRARATDVPAVFWLDVNRAHDAQVIAKVYQALATMDTHGVQISILAPAEAARYTVARMRHGLDTISVTGNVLRDYLTDLFPILEVGTSAKMLSIVPLLAGGGLFETGAGGSAPKHVQQLLEEDYLRWDSLGEFFALAASFEHLSEFTGNAKAKVLADTLDAATGTFLEEDRSPGRALGTIDNRGSHFYLALYWAQELAQQTADAELAAAFAPVAEKLAADEQAIVAELNAVQGSPVDIGGYYHPDAAKVAQVMRPSATLNGVIDAI